MKKDSKKSGNKQKEMKYEFSGSELTKYSGTAVIMKYIKKEKINEELDKIYPTEQYSATKYSNMQVIMTIILGTMSGINRALKLSNFSGDSLIKRLLGLPKHINKDAITGKIKTLGRQGAIDFQTYSQQKVKGWIERSENKEITIDCDSTVQTVYGNQQGAERGYNPKKKGAKSYHSLLAFVSQMKIVVNTRFRSGSSYTSNGIVSFIEEIKEQLPKTIQSLFFRADSGFFSGELFDKLEEYGWGYLVKVKLKNLSKTLAEQKWERIDAIVSVCEFEYKCKDWQKARKLKAIRTRIGSAQVEYFGKMQELPLYEYACYCSTLELRAEELHNKYKERSTSENWIEQVKNQLLAGRTLTQDFYTNDFLWQLSVMAYNISVMMRYEVMQKAKEGAKYFRQEHTTFREWFIELPAKIINSGRQQTIKIYKDYYYRKDWEEFATLLLS